MNKLTGSKYFIAICRDNLQSDKGFYYTVYLVNNTDKEIGEIKTSSYGYCTIGEKLVKTSTAVKEIKSLSPYSFVALEEADEGTWDFVTVYEVKMHSSGNRSEYTFHISKGLSGLEKASFIPVLEKEGFIVAPWKATE